jgi:hypothetical protein
VTFALRERDYTTKELDTDNVAKQIALAWSESVPTLKHTIVRIDYGIPRSSSKCGFEVVKRVDGRVEVQSIPKDRVSATREEYDRRGSWE